MRCFSYFSNAKSADKERAQPLFQIFQMDFVIAYRAVVKFASQCRKSVNVNYDHNPKVSSSKRPVPLQEKVKEMKALHGSLLHRLS